MPRRKSVRSLVRRLPRLRELEREMLAPPPRPRRTECLQAVLRDLLALAEAAAADDASDEDIALAMYVLEPGQRWMDNLQAMLKTIEATSAPDITTG